MGILDDIARRQDEASDKKVCKYRDLLNSLTPEELDAVLLVHTKIANGDPMFTIKWLVDTLNANQRSIGKTVVSEHLRGVCACE